MKSDEYYLTMLDKCVEFHGHLCLGQVFGVRVAAKGMELAAPPTVRDLIVAVEVDRCLADAVLVVTGARLGRRNFKLYNYGRMAASFLNCSTGRAFRVHIAYDGPSPDHKDVDAMRRILLLPDEQVVAWEEIEFSLPEEEMPGKPRRVVTCSVCGERVFDGKDRPGPTGPTCQACLGGKYYLQLHG